MPLKRTITLRGGFFENGSGEELFLGAEGFPTLAPAAQEVPGGLTANIEPALLPQPLRATYEKDVAAGRTKVTATVELAGPPSAIVLNEANILRGTGTGLGLPTKVKLTNAFLGPDCYVGSNEAPINIELTTGTSGALTGKLGVESSNREGTILTISQDSLVNNTYEAPGVSGCGEGGQADAAVDAKIGLPAGSGSNSVTINGTLKQAGAEEVREAGI